MDRKGNCTTPKHQEEKYRESHSICKKIWPPSYLPPKEKKWYAAAAEELIAEFVVYLQQLIEGEAPWIIGISKLDTLPKLTVPLPKLTIPLYKAYWIGGYPRKRSVSRYSRLSHPKLRNIPN